MSKLETAYHEAGHAVALYAKGIPMQSVSIMKEQGSLGRADSAHSPEFWRYKDGAEEIMYALLVCDRAGVKAVEMLTGRSTQPDDPNADIGLHGSDFRRAATWYLEELCGSDKNRREEVWQQTEMEAERVLRENWATVEAVARQLLEHTSLDAMALQSTLQRAGCEHDDGAVRRAILHEEHEQLLRRSIELWRRYKQLTAEAATESELRNLAEEVQAVDRRRKEIGTCLWGAQGDDA